MNETRQIDELESAKLNELNPVDLIPPEFANIPTVAGQISIVTRQLAGHIDYIVVDEATMSLNEIEDRFTYLDDGKLGEYPELERGNNRYARPLVHGSMTEISTDILFNDMLETNPALRGKGAGVAFLKHLEDLARNLGYKFLAGYQNDAKTARFFLKRGRYLLEEIKDELQAEFQALREQEDDGSVFHTISFLNPEDVAKYIKPERIDTDVEDKIEFKEKILTLSNIFYQLSAILKRVEENEDGLGDRATLIEIMEDLNLMLPEEDQYDLPELSEDDDNLIFSLKILLAHLKNKFSTLIRVTTLNKLRENIV